MPAYVARLTRAPKWGVIFLIVGLCCFVAANIVGAAG
jgi:hypothetical protein